MKFIGNRVATAKSGYQRTLSRYQARNRNGCPIRGACHKSKNNRIIEVSHNLIELRKRARELLNSEKGIAHRKKRPVDIEGFWDDQTKQGVQKVPATRNRKSDYCFRINSFST